jgi:hypothetical protein
MADLSKSYIFRMTHIENIPHILRYGITHINSPNRNPDYVPIGDATLIGTRHAYSIPNTSKTLGDYIPFYFFGRMPMLYVVQKGINNVPVTPAEQIVYVVSSVAQIIEHQLEFLFTNGHAVDGFSSFHGASDVGQIDDILDYNAIKAKYWKNEQDLDLKRRKQAEFLVAQDIPVSAILGYLVYNQAANERLVSMGVEKKIAIRENFYF